MQLWQALRVHKGEVASLVGAGGKTTAMYRLGHELAAQGWRVVTTTTTMIRPPSPDQTANLIVTDRLEQALILVQEAFRRRRLVTLAAHRLQAENKLRGIDPAWILGLLPLADAIIVEADGARGLPLKAPAAHEPVIPDRTTLLVPVVGISAVGQLLTEGTVHRPEFVAELSGLALGQVIQPSTLAALLVHPRGALKGAPERARVVPLVNQVCDEQTLAAARQVAAGALRATPRIERVLLSAVAREEPVVESWRRVAAVVLAAGGSTRFGRPKQLLPLGESTMIEQVLSAVMAASVDQVVVVLGSSAAQIAERIPAGCRIVVNREWESGISSSIRAGLELVDPGVEAALFVLADQPCITGTALRRILQAYYARDKTIVVPTVRGQRGAPVLFDRRLFPELQALWGDVGGRQVLACHEDQVQEVEMESSDVFLDVDTLADYRRLLGE